MVVNFDEASEPGTHWVAIYAPNRFYVRYFDSLGGQAVPKIDDYLRKKFAFHTKQQLQIQHHKASTCGYYALYFIYMSCMKFSLSVIQSQLKNRRNPDKFVVNYVSKHIV